MAAKHPTIRSVRKASRPPPPMQEVVVRAQPTLPDVAAAIQTLQKSVQALSQQLTHAENDTVHNVNEYVYANTKVIDDDLNSGFGDVKSDREFIHTILMQDAGQIR
jgi:hypothetical protein